MAFALGVDEVVSDGLSKISGTVSIGGGVTVDPPDLPGQLNPRFRDGAASEKLNYRNQDIYSGSRGELVADER